MDPDNRDHLTGLLTRAAFDAALPTCFAEASGERPASLVLSDVDHFKRINDNHGHQAGDVVLKELARRLLQTVQGKGAAYRYGGEEFAVILPNHSVDEALAVAERARRAAEASKVGSVAVTSSCGIAVVPLHASSAEQWLQMADRALYDAKNLGRNLVRISGEPPPRADRARQPARKQAVPGTLSEEAEEKLRLDILRSGRAPCPVDQIPLTAHDMTTHGEVGRSFMVRCPACGFNAKLLGPGRG